MASAPRFGESGMTLDEIDLHNHAQDAIDAGVAAAALELGFKRGGGDASGVAGGQRECNVAILGPAIRALCGRPLHALTVCYKRFVIHVTRKAR